MCSIVLAAALLTGESAPDHSWCIKKGVPASSLCYGCAGCFGCYGCGGYRGCYGMSVADVDAAERRPSTPTNCGGETASGSESQPYSFTLDNPYADPVNFLLNDKTYSLAAGESKTISGQGTAKMTFDIGRGDGTEKSYTPQNGETYYFKWKTAQVPNREPVFLLDLYKLQIFSAPSFALPTE